MDNAGRTVVVAGGGYSGVMAANRVRGRLPKTDRVVLVTPQVGLTQRIRLHERAVHGTDVSVPYERLLARGVEQVPGKLVGLSAAAGCVTIEHDGKTRELGYSALILAMGSELRPRIPIASRYALALYDEAHALQLSAALPKQPEGARVSIVGGGLTAIELASEIAETYPQLRVEMLCDRFAEGLTQGAPGARQALLDELTALGVQVREGARVRALEQNAVVLEDGTREACAMSVLASGFNAVPLPAAFGLGAASRPDGRIEVDAQLRAAGTTDVFVAGDLAAPPAHTIGAGLATTRMACATAIPLGAHVADQVARLLLGQPLQPYSMKYAAQCVSIGRRRAVVLFVDADDKPTGRLVRGRKAAFIKEGICRMVVGALRLERWLPGLYSWPKAAGPKLLAADALSNVES